MIEPQSMQLGASAWVENATFGPPPREPPRDPAKSARVRFPLPFPLAWPLAAPFDATVTSSRCGTETLIDGAAGAEALTTSSATGAGAASTMGAGAGAGAGVWTASDWAVMPSLAAG